MTVVWQGQIWENAATADFMESFEDLGLKMDIYTCSNEFMKILE